MDQNLETELEIEEDMKQCNFPPNVYIERKWPFGKDEGLILLKDEPNRVHELSVSNNTQIARYQLMEVKEIHRTETVNVEVLDLRD